MTGQKTDIAVFPTWGPTSVVNVGEERMSLTHRKV